MTLPPPLEWGRDDDGFFDPAFARPQAPDRRHEVVDLIAPNPSNHSPAMSSDGAVSSADDRTDPRNRWTRANS